MHLTIHTKNKAVRYIEIADGASLIDALRASEEMIIAPCGGAGTCGRCQVLVRDHAGISYRLACQTPAEDGQEIFLEDIEEICIEGVHKEQLPLSLTDRVNENKFDSYAAPSYGIAIDIGTTTIAAYLINLDNKETVGTAGRVNPQTMYGSDVIARIEAAIQPAGMTALCCLLRNAIDQLIHTLCQIVCIDSLHIKSLVIAGNTIMEHFATGLNPVSIGRAPFAPISLFGSIVNLYKTPESTEQQAYIIPAIAGYVGGDIVAGLHASGMTNSKQLQLFIDIGTNGEMALGNCDRIICCATAAGPAFEGASITFGMPAMPGAICSVRISEGNLHIDTIDSLPAVGICGSGLLDAISCLLEAGIIDETGRIVSECEPTGSFSCISATLRGEDVCYLDSEQGIYLTQDDIRQVQLAKAALRAGVETMLDKMGVTHKDIVELALAGGFGMRLNPISAAQIGLFPPDLLARVVQLGNAAGRGAVFALFDEDRACIENLARTCEYIELSTCATFNEHYLDAMGFDD